MKESQKTSEFIPFLEHVKGKKSLLEIGSRFGDSLVKMASVMQEGSTIISVEYPGHQTGRPGSAPVLQKKIDILCDVGHNASVIFGNSHDESIRKQVEQFAPFDVVFIDGDHSYNGVMQDWLDYGCMGSIVGFHDACATVWDASKVWSEIKENYEHREYFDLNGDPKRYMGIGVLFNA